MSTITTYLHRDDRGPLSAWITEPRISLAVAISNAGAALSRLGHRIHDEAPGDYGQGADDWEAVGYRLGHKAGTRDTLELAKHAFNVGQKAATR